MNFMPPQSHQVIQLRFLEEDGDVGVCDLAVALDIYSSGEIKHVHMIWMFGPSSAGDGDRVEEQGI